MNIKQKYWLLSLGFIGLTLAFLAGMGVYVWQGIDPQVRAQIFQNTEELIGLAFLGGTLLLMILLFFLNEMFQTYILPLDKLTEDSSVMTGADFAHRAELRGCSELVQLADRMNQAAKQLQQMSELSTREADAEPATLERENAFLARALLDLPQGIILLNPWQQIVSFNSSARQIYSRVLQRQGSEEPTVCYLGVGRSIYDLFDGQLLDRALNAASRDNFDSEAPAAFCLGGECPRGDGEMMRILPLMADQAGQTGYLLQMERCGEAGASWVCSAREDVSAREGEESKSTDLQEQLPYTREEAAAGRIDSDLLLRPAPKPPLDEIPLERLPCTVFDLETTGLDPYGGDEIVSVSAVRVLNNRILPEEAFHMLLDPGRDIPPDARSVHGISQEMVRGKPGADKVLPYFRFYARDSVLVSHCAEFDMVFLSRKAQQTGGAFDNPVLDTILLAALVLSSRRDLSLEATAEELGARVHSRHSSLGDALTAAQIYLRLIPLLANHGIRTLEQARQASKKVRKCVNYSRMPRICDLQTS